MALLHLEKQVLFSEYWIHSDTNGKLANHRVNAIPTCSLGQLQGHSGSSSAEKAVVAHSSGSPGRDLQLDLNIGLSLCHSKHDGRSRERRSP